MKLWCFLALVQLTYGSHSSDGLLEILYQGDWYATCQYPHYSNAEVVCKELGYDRGFVSFQRSNRFISESQYKFRPYCKGTEGSIYDCISHQGVYFVSNCYSSTEYSCQGTNSVANFIL